MILLLGFAFLSGLVTILAPCVWPLLPIILSASVSQKGHQRPLGIVLGIMLSFAVFTLSVSYLVKFFHFDPNSLRIAAVIIITFLGLTMIIPALSRLVEVAVSRLSGIWGQTGQQTGSGFLPGFITGLSLGIVWSPCAGPILAAIATLAATGQVSLQVIFVTLAYVTGVGVPLFIFAYGGQQVITRTRFISPFTGRIQQIFGIIMILTAIAIFTNYDTKILNIFPDVTQTFNQLSNNKNIQTQINALKGKSPANQQTTTDTSGLFNVNYPAPDFVGITKWLNLPAGQQSLSIKDLKGKVVLIDFWTYTCINCIRTLPFVTNWYDKYHNQGFVVIGVHTPEFQFEHETNNVLDAIKQYKIHYPVPQDNNYATWNNYNNEFWPAEYLIDAKGNVRRTHFGEGEYDQTEMAIKALLQEAGKKVASGLADMPDQTPNGNQSPETYLGTTRMQYYYPNGSVGQGVQTFTLSNNLPLNTFDFGGQWNITADNAITAKGATLQYHFTADKVFLVLRPGTAGNNAQVKVLLDGQLVTVSSSGSDVKNSLVTIDSDRLYNLIDLKGKAGEHTLKLEFQNTGIQAFAFTFG
jgi:cytochrome c biogenesis protein CcdA/thiol-disulfide isomerase/thioredoxin